MRRVEGLDLLRGVAIALVLLHHAFPAALPGAGVVGVVMFFALSGFLITGLLLDEHARTGRIDLAGFYRRRAVRLGPALVVLVAAVVLVTLTLDPLEDRGELPRTVLFALTWTGDLPFGHASDATFHLWTLATEEQFYLLWPAVVVVGLAHRRVRVALLATAVACAAACAVTTAWFAEAPDLAYALPTSWAGCFVVGAGTRILLPRPGLRPTARGVVVLGTSLAVLSVIPLRGHALTYLAGGPIIATLTSALLLAWRDWEHVSGHLARALVWLGSVSYAAYLWNYPLTLWLRPHVAHGAGVLALLLTLVMAVVSLHLVEEPARRWSARRHRTEAAVSA